MNGYLTGVTGLGEVLRIPMKMKGYEVDEVVGCGAFGVVVTLLDVNKNEKLAAKVIKRPEKNGAEMLALERELRLAVSLSCPYLVECIDVVYFEEVICILMEYVEGETLDKLILSNGGMVRSYWKKLFWQICMAVEYLHSRGLAHRDIKLENVIVDEDFNLKLCDYGIMCETGPATISTTICGTAPYLSPELIKGSGYSAKQSDIWALGICLYAIVTGTFPWHSLNRFALYKEILEVSEIDTSVLPFETRQIVARCCDPIVENRLTMNDILRLEVMEMAVIRPMKAGRSVCFVARRAEPTTLSNKVLNQYLGQHVRRASKELNGLLPQRSMGGVLRQRAISLLRT